MPLYCGCVKTCVCNEEFNIPPQRPNTPVDETIINLVSNPIKVSRSTQTENSQYTDNVLDRLHTLSHIHQNNRDTLRLLKDLKVFILK